jgi:uncharacterized membrane protein YuzA (DUF378 family)
MKVLNYVTLALIIVGGLNWGLVGAANFNLVASIFGEGTTLSNIVYILVGLSAVVQAALAFTRTSTAPHAVPSH